LRLGPPSSSRSLTRPGSSTSPSGISRIDASAAAPDHVHPGLAPPPRSSARVGPPPPVLDPLHLGSSPPPRSFGRPGPIASPYGLACSGSVFSLPLKRP
jgi:hypothetical protein